MASIQSLGVGSGLLTSELIEDIIAAEREATDLRINAEKAEFAARISSFGTIKSTLETLRSAADALSRSSSLLTNVTTSSNELAVSAEASPAAAPGVHSVEVLSLARSHTLASIRFDELDSVVGDGTLEFKFGTTTFSGGNYDTFTENPDKVGGSVVIDGSNNTLSGIRDSVNEANIGVTASIVNDGEGYVLVFTTAASGEANGMEITVTEGGVPGLAAFSFNSAASTPGVNLTQTVAADDARMTIDGILVRRDNNTFSEVVEGVTFTAQSLNVGAPATISVAQDSQDLSARLQAFVDAFNTVKGLTDQLTAFDEDVGVGALLMGDSMLRNVRSQMRRMLGNSVVGLESTSLRSLVDLGITTDQNAGYTLRFDPRALQAALASSPSDVAALLSDQARASDNLIQFASFQPGTAAGSYDVEITRLATQGLLVGAATPGLAGPVTIDADNDELSLVVDGVTASGITLTQGVYADGFEVAQMLTTVVNANPALTTAGVEVEVSYDDVAGTLLFTSKSFGSSSQVGISTIDTSTTASLGLAVATGEASSGVDVAGTVNGITGLGSGQFLSVPTVPAPASSGSFTGAAVTSFDAPPLTLDAGNNNFTLAVDGITGGVITLTPGDYADGDAVAGEMQAQINADPTLIAAGKSVSVEYDAIDKRFRIVSASTSNGSTVAVIGIAAGVEAALGLTTGSGVPGTPASKSIDVAGGIQLKVLGGTTGPRGQVTLVRGVMNQFDRYLDSVLNFNGTLDTKLGVLEERIDELNSEADGFNKRMDLLEDRLRLQFAAADALISQLNSTSSFLEQQFRSLQSLNGE